MAERMISRADAADLKRRLDRMVDELEDEGFERAMIGAAMMGIGTGLRVVHDGVEATLVGLDMVRAVVLESSGRKN